MQSKESKTNKHFLYSSIKSGFRIMAGVALILGDFWYAGMLLITAEVFGIVEEL